MTTPAAYALFGSPIQRSPSPAMHNAAFTAMGVPARYHLRPARRDEAAAVIDEVRRGLWRGANVTTPLKILVGERVPLRGAAIRARAVNTLCWEEETLVGHLTDVQGVSDPLRLRDLPQGHAVILGAGGAARAAALAVEELGREVRWLVRDVAKGQATAQALGIAARTTDVVALSDTAGAITLLSRAAVIVQATPVGGQGEVHDLPWHAVRNDCVAFEMLYRPQQTAFLAAAARHGCRCIEGWEMLLAQGAAAFSLWTGCAAPMEIMRAALLADLGGDRDHPATG